MFVYLSTSNQKNRVYKITVMEYCAYRKLRTWKSKYPQKKLQKIFI